MDRTIDQLLREAPKLAAIFEDFGIDVDVFGPRLLADVILEKNLPDYIISEEVEKHLEREETKIPDENSDITQVLDYLVFHHHKFAREKAPLIQTKLTRLAETYKGNYIDIKHLLKVFNEHATDLYTHMRNEEFLLFPYLRELKKSIQTGVGNKIASKPLLGQPISLMQAEHSRVETELQTINALSKGYSVPPDGNETYARVMQELESWEEDMKLHNQIENTLLANKANQLESEFKEKFLSP
jgi:regulator of cell morphogenesis and NO signaling